MSAIWAERSSNRCLRFVSCRGRFVPDYGVAHAPATLDINLLARHNLRPAAESDHTNGVVSMDTVPRARRHHVRGVRRAAWRSLYRSPTCSPDPTGRGGPGAADFSEGYRSWRRVEQGRKRLWRTSVASSHAYLSQKRPKAAGLEVLTDSPRQQSPPPSGSRTHDAVAARDPLPQRAACLVVLRYYETSATGDRRRARLLARHREVPAHHSLTSLRRPLPRRTATRRTERELNYVPRPSKDLGPERSSCRQLHDPPMPSLPDSRRVRTTSAHPAGRRRMPRLCRRCHRLLATLPRRPARPAGPTHACTLDRTLASPTHRCPSPISRGAPTIPYVQDRRLVRGCEHARDDGGRRRRRRPGSRVCMRSPVGGPTGPRCTSTPTARTSTRRSPRTQHVPCPVRERRWDPDRDRHNPNGHNVERTPVQHRPVPTYELPRDGRHGRRHRGHPAGRPVPHL